LQEEMTIEGPLGEDNSQREGKSVYFGYYATGAKIAEINVLLLPPPSSFLLLLIN